MTDIVKRLLADGDKPSQREARILLWEELKDAADEIERLRDVLRFYACECSDAEACETFGNYERSACGYKARQALGEKK